MNRIDWHDERGQVAGIEAIPFGLLVFVSGILLAANVWAVVDVKMTVTSAAREAVRAYVEADNRADGLAAAEAAAREAVTAHGRDADELVIEAPTGPFVRCGRATFEVRYRAPALSVPSIGGYGDGLVVRATHSEVIDPFRTGDFDEDGRAAC